MHFWEFNLVVASGPGMDLHVYMHDHGARCNWMCTRPSGSVICVTVCGCSTGRDPTMFVNCVPNSKQLHTCELPLRFAFCSDGLLAGSQYVSGRSCYRPAPSSFSMVFLCRRANAEVLHCPYPTPACFLCCFLCCCFLCCSPINKISA